jgi:hypothetical protein
MRSDEVSHRLETILGVGLMQAIGEGHLNQAGLVLVAMKGGVDRLGPSPSSPDSTSSWLIFRRARHLERRING